MAGLVLLRIEILVPIWFGTRIFFQENTSFFSDPTLSHGKANNNSSMATKVNNHNVSNKKYNGKSMNHMNLDDTTINDMVKVMTVTLNNMKEDRKTMSRDELQKILNKNSSN